MTIKNVGDLGLFYGAGFDLDRKTGSGWREVMPNAPHIASGHILKPGGTDRDPLQRAWVPKNTEPGTYRLSKGFESDDGLLLVRIQIEVRKPGT